MDDLTLTGKNEIGLTRAVQGQAEPNDQKLTTAAPPSFDSRAMWAAVESQRQRPSISYKKTAVDNQSASFNR